jgi:hypothetical protein
MAGSFLCETVCARLSRTYRFNASVESLVLPLGVAIAAPDESGGSDFAIAFADAFLPDGDGFGSFPSVRRSMARS